METIIITGAGTGIGAAAAERLSHRKNTRLILVGRRAEKLEKVRESLVGEHLVWSMDVANRMEWRHLLQSDEANLIEHPLVGLFANAGIGGPNSFDFDAALDAWDEIIRINLTGTYISVEACKPYFEASKTRGERHVVVTSSVLARFGVPGQAAYVASKTGLLGLVRSWASSWSCDGILVNAICPGWVDTEMAKNSIAAMAVHSGQDFDQEYAHQADLLPTKHMSSPREVAELVHWLMSDVQRSITGQALDMNNGSFMI
jgi:NAD(P)-dependent dehydrogenase (short-subunit alcohol dehydrogenase family)